MDRAERRLAAIMFTDIVGYTALAQASEAEALVRLEDHRAILRSAFLRHNGNEVKTMGDAFLIEFPSALEAVECSIDIQTQIHDRNAHLPGNKQIQLRIGVHVGDVVHRGGDILGDAVNVSSRIEPLTEPGGVCITEQVFDHVRNKLDLPLEKLEQKSLKNVSLPIDVYRIVMPWEVEEKERQEIAKVSADADGRRRLGIGANRSRRAPPTWVAEIRGRANYPDAAVCLRVLSSVRAYCRLLLCEPRLCPDPGDTSSAKERSKGEFR